MQVNGNHQSAGASVPPPAPGNATATSTNGNGSTGRKPALQFRKAVKYDARGRVALIGPAGAGKSYTMLQILRELVGPTGKIACIDTEHGSLSKYADLFEFDVLELDSYSPENFLAALQAAQDAGYDGFGCDSLSHFWMGKDGALEYVDMAAKRSQSRDGMSGWKDFSPIERKMVDAMLASSCHVVTTMRTKTEYQEQIAANGKKQRVKIGLAPVQRQGLEYEFDLIGYMDEENNFITDKTRCPDYARKVLDKPKGRDFTKFATWLKGQKREEPPVVQMIQTAVPINTGGHQPGTVAAAQFVAEQKIQSGDTSTSKPWRTFGELKQVFAQLREQVGETDFSAELQRYGWRAVGDIKNPTLATECYHHLQFLAERADEQRKEVA